jgi:hypothetical protein
MYTSHTHACIHTCIHVYKHTFAGRNWKILTSGVVEDMDEGTGDKSSEAKIGEVLGIERRDKLISAVYMLRSDCNPSVCQASFQVRLTRTSVHA